MREVTSHKLVEHDDETNELSIGVMDEPGPGGANHLYRIAGQNTSQDIKFQNELGRALPALRSNARVG